MPVFWHGRWSTCSARTRSECRLWLIYVTAVMDRLHRKSLECIKWFHHLRMRPDITVSASTIDQSASFADTSLQLIAGSDDVPWHAVLGPFPNGRQNYNCSINQLIIIWCMDVDGNGYLLLPLVHLAHFSLLQLAGSIYFLWGQVAPITTIIN